MAYLRKLYRRTMDEAYARAMREIALALREGGACLDCGAGDGYMRDRLKLPVSAYHGIEWNASAVAKAQAHGLDVIHGDLNATLPYPDGSMHCVYGLSVLEHLLNPCRYLREAQRVLAPGGTLVVLTPNISTYFTAALILAGRMPSSGPHPDSDALLKHEELFKVSDEELQPDTEIDTPSHRHLVVFSYRVLWRYLAMLGFDDIRGYGFGVYPFPNFMQPLLEKVDPWHAHQMVFVAQKP